MTQVIKDVVEWLQQWFYTEDEIDDMLADLPTGGGITSITLVPYSENQNGVICYNGGVAPTPTPVQVVDSVSLSSDVSILSAYDSDTATLSATVLDGDNQAIPNVSVEFFKGNTSLGSTNTNNNGIATKTYSANGDGELTFKAVADNVEDETTIIDAKFHTTDLSHFSNYKTDMMLSDYTAPLSGTIYLEVTGNLQFVLGNAETNTASDWCWVVTRTSSIHINSSNSQVTTNYSTTNSFIIEYTTTSFKLTCGNTVKVNVTGLKDMSSKAHTFRLYTRSQTTNLKSITVL